MSAEQFEAGPSLGTLIGGILHDLKDLFQGEMKLARIEFDQKIRKVILGVVFIVGSALVAFAGLIVFFLGIAAALAVVLPVWAALLIVGAASLMGAAVLARVGVAVLSLKALAPSRTWSSLQRDAHFIREHV
ncbi:phage holin family protein [Acidisoma sp. L85]|uniref:phage holin family protein n=1 Tax=Acidisoma sp. L85 TaxID=1641850 RepID=UPI00131ACC53|nr:phage holin family protein [Acidisoma sp. L85]